MDPNNFNVLGISSEEKKVSSSLISVGEAIIIADLLKFSNVILLNMQSLFPTEPFTIKYGETLLKIHPMEELQGRIGFTVYFSSKRKPIRVIRATDANGVRFWTSLPQGRQTEAEGVGKILEEYARIKMAKEAEYKKK